MNTPPITDATPAEPTAAASEPAATGFAALFGAAARAAKRSDQPFHTKGLKSGHEKKIGPAPNGTRRSMGKR
jgi:hypothetical protein